MTYFDNDTCSAHCATCAVGAKGNLVHIPDEELCEVAFGGETEIECITCGVVLWTQLQSREGRVSADNYGTTRCDDCGAEFLADDPLLHVACNGHGEYGVKPISRPMTFDTWRASHVRYVWADAPDDILDHCTAQADCAETIAVHIYCCGSFIAETDEGYYLPLEREEHEGTELVKLERILHAWSVDANGVLEEPA